MAADINLVAMRGSVAATPEVRVYDSGTRVLRLLVAVSTESPTRRIDVIPVLHWDPTDALIEGLTQASTNDPPPRVWVVGSVQRRSLDGPNGRHSRIEVVSTALVVIDE